MATLMAKGFVLGKDALAKGNSEAACTAFIASQAADPALPAIAPASV